MLHLKKIKDVPYFKTINDEKHIDKNIKFVELIGKVNHVRIM